ncbi:myosin-2 essential light chain [Drosophila tropicalis]|uniref:myosin-2 essential light chain n=1 Tax=Drosophila tropicalis TaxID=46794 RepID=UPI0035AC02B7
MASSPPQQSTTSESESAPTATDPGVADLEKKRRIFLMHDMRRDGKIGIVQLGDCLRVMGINPSEACVRQHQQQLRAGAIGRISFNEFISIYKKISKEMQNNPCNLTQQAEEFISTLRVFDEEGNGHMPAARLRHILTQCGDCMSPTEMNELLNNRVNEQGLVNYIEFVHAIMNG